MDRWIELKISELGNVVTGNTPSSQFPDEFGNAIPFITPSDYKNYTSRWAEKSDRGLSAKGLAKLEKKKLPAGSILVTCIGSDMGKVVMNKIPAITNQQINSIIPNTTVIDPAFLYYKLLQSYQILRTLGQAGTAVPILNKSDFERIMLAIPEKLQLQKNIGYILSALDDKIELLHRQNETLEHILITLSKHFLEGGMPQPVNELINIRSGYSFKSSEFSDFGAYRLVTIKNVQDGRLELANMDAIISLPPNMPPHCVLSPADILLSLTGNVGRACLVDENNLVLNQRVAKLEPRQPRDWAFCYSLFRQEGIKKRLEDLAKGTAQANLSPIELGQLEINIPVERQLEMFSATATPLLQKVMRNKLQIKTLSQFKNYLLPKITCGELQLSNVQAK